MHLCQRYAALLTICLLLGGCASPRPSPPETAATGPSPTIAAVAAPAPAALPSRGIAPAATATLSIPKTTPTTMPGGFNYLWPAYLPEGMQLATQESRVAQEGEIGKDNLGFFLITFSGDGGKRKLSLGGGAVEAFKLEGEKKEVQIAGRPATLITQEQQHLVLLQAPRGTLFVLGAGLNVDEVLKVAESLEPTDVRTIRQKLTP